MASDLRRRIGDIARERFGFEGLRPGQGEAIESAVSRRDTLAGARERRESLAELEAGELEFLLNSRVAHAQWGGGVVFGYDDGRVTVLFDAVGYKSLGLDLIAEGRLLEPERR